MILTPEELRDRIPERAYDTLIEAGLADTDLSGYSIDDLKAIHGIGPTWAREIRAALDNIASPQGQPNADKTQDVFKQALALLTGCGRRADVANLKASSEPVEDKVQTAISILQNLPGGDRGRNLANQVRDMLE